MRPLITALAIGLFMALSGPAQADGIWDGGDGSDNLWSTAINWNGNAVPTTGQNIVLDSANDRGGFIPDDTCDYDSSATAGPYTGTFRITGMTFSASRSGGFSSTGNATWSGSWTMGGSEVISLGGTSVTSTMTLSQNNTTTDLDVNSLLIDADTPGAARSFTKAGAGTLDVNGPLTIKGDLSADHDATLVLSAGSITPDSMVLQGSTNSSYGYAILDLDQDLTVGNASDSVSVAGYAEIDVANPGTAKVFEAKDMDVGDGQLTTFCEKRTGTGELDATGLTITAGNDANEEATFKLSAGTLDVNGTITVDSGTASGTHAKLWHSVGTATPDSMVLDGYDTNARAKLDLDQTFTVDSGGTHAKPDTTMRRWVDVDVYAGMTGDMKDLRYEATGTLTVTGSGTFRTDEFRVEDASADAAITVTKAGSSGVTIDNDLIIQAADSAGEHAKLLISAGSMTVDASADTKINAATSVNADAMLEFDSGTFDPSDLYLYGGNSDLANYGEALVDYNGGTLVNPDSVTIQGYSKFNAEAGITVDGALTVDAGTYATEAEIDMAASTTFAAASVVIGDASHACTLTFSGAGSGETVSSLVTN